VNTAGGLFADWSMLRAVMKALWYRPTLAWSPVLPSPLTS
jgi:hypothetical protein